MNNQFVRTDSFVLKKHKLRIYRVTEPKSATVFWTTEQQALNYVQKLQIQQIFTKIVIR